MYLSMVASMLLEELLDLRQKMAPSPRRALVPDRRGSEYSKLWQVLLRGTARYWLTVMDLKWFSKFCQSGLVLSAKNPFCWCTSFENFAMNEEVAFSNALSLRSW